MMSCQQRDGLTTKNATKKNLCVHQKLLAYKLDKVLANQWSFVWQKLSVCGTCSQRMWNAECDFSPLLTPFARYPLITWANKVATHAAHIKKQLILHYHLIQWWMKLSNLLKNPTLTSHYKQCRYLFAKLKKWVKKNDAMYTYAELYIILKTRS